MASSLPAAAGPAGHRRPFPAFSASLASPASSASPVARLLSLPPKWLQGYDDFITKNVGQVSQIESALRSLTYIIPGRFRDAEIASEAIHSGVQLLSLYHDLLLLRPSSPALVASASGPSKATPAESVHAPPPSQHTRYTRFWIQKSPFYRRVAIVLQIVRYTELLCEMAAKRRGERIRWRVIVLIEAVKAFCRLLLLRATRGRTLVTPSLPERQPLPESESNEEEEEEGYGEDSQSESHADHLEAPEDEAEQEAAQPMQEPEKAAVEMGMAPGPQPPLSPPPSPSLLPARPRTPSSDAPDPASAWLPPSPPPTLQHEPLAYKKGWTMPRTGMPLPPLPLPGDISSYLLSRVLTADDIKPAAKLLNKLRGPGQAAEILHIMAPLVFAVALARTRGAKGKRLAWTPWLLGLAFECVARQLRDHSLRTTTLEREEWSRRGWAMGWWAMRGACYENVMKGVVGGVRRRLPSFIGGIVEDYEYLWENYYFSTSPL